MRWSFITHRISFRFTAVIIAGVLGCVLLIAIGSLRVNERVVSPIGEEACCFVTLSDPLDPEHTLKNYPVELILDSQGLLSTYGLSLITGVCSDGLCWPVSVKLFWNSIGDYLRLEYPENLPLTKDNHVPFSQQDYDVLDAVLKDKNSILGEYPLNSIANHSNGGSLNVEGVTGATPQDVQDAVVPGAAYTSWVLWHWVNGEIKDQLQTITLSHGGTAWLMHCLELNDQTFVSFALQQILLNGDNSPEMREACFRVLEDGGRESCLSALQILTRNPPDTDKLHQQLIGLIGVNGGSTPLILNYFEDLRDAPPAVWELMAGQLEKISTFYDLNAILHVLESRANHSKAVRNTVNKLLQHQDQFVIRRAEEFLNK